MAGFLTRRESRKQYESIGGGNFNDAYRSQKDALRQSGLRGRDLRQAARQAVIDDQNLTNIQNTALQDSEQYAPTEDMITGMEMAGYDQNEKQMQRDNSAFRQNFLNAQPIEVSSMPAQIQTKQAQTPTGETTSAAIQPAVQPAMVGTPQATNATVETPAPGQPAQIRSAPVAQSEEPDYSSMSFNDAFGAARKLKGKDGMLEWKGKSYGLKYADEIAAEKAATAKAKPAAATQKTNVGTTTPSTPVASPSNPTSTATRPVQNNDNVKP